MEKTILYKKLAIYSFLAMSLNSFAQFNQIDSNIAAQGLAELNGNKVALDNSGNFMAIGAPLHLNLLSNQVGAVRIYQNTGGSLTQIGSEIEGSVIGAEFGQAIDINNLGTRVIIGSPLDALGGKTRVFEWNGATWNQVGADIPGGLLDDSGRSVSMSKDGNIIAIGEPLYGGAIGRVRVFEWTGAVWSQIGSDIVGESLLDQSGWDISLNDAGTRIAIGAPLNQGGGIPLPGAGHVRVYEYDLGSWMQLGSDIDGDNLNADNMGWSVDLDSDGNNLVSGMPLALDILGGIATGKSRVYNLNAGSWNQVGSDIDGQLLNDQAGWDVSINTCGNRVVIGAPLSDTNGSLLDTGNVKVYDNIGGNTWVNTNTIQGDSALEQFGWTTALNDSGYTFFAGAPLNSLGGVGKLYQDETDTDGDLIFDSVDADSDNDGIPDSFETDICGYLIDTDGDGVPDYRDLDSDNDGILDVDEGGNGDLDTNGDGMINSSDTGHNDTAPADGQADGSVDIEEEPDTDGDGVPDYRDLDSDNDGINDSIEGGNDSADTNGDGMIDSNDTGGSDADDDGIADSIDGSGAYGDSGNSDQQDSDNDGVPDSQDLDSDDDGVLDVEEGNNSSADTNGDGVIDSDDTGGADTDGDGISDSVDDDSSNYGDSGNTDTVGNNSSDPTDPNSGGTGVIVDGDNDGDGIVDNIDDCDNVDGTPEFGLCSSILSNPENELIETKIYPNPAKNFINISIVDQIVIQSIKIYNISGKLIIKIKNIEQQNAYKINIESFESGIYILSLTHKDGIINKKLIIE